METIVNPLAFALLLTSLYILRFRGWQRPFAVVVYFIFFAAMELVVARYFLPPDAFGPGLGKVCLGLTVPVLLAAFGVWRYERSQGELG